MDGMSSVARVFATLFIWTAATILGAGALMNSMFLSGLPVIIIMVILIAAAATATQSVWKFPEVGESVEKSKRRDKLDRMLDKLDQDDIEELRARLMAESDGEQVTLDELLAERQRQNIGD